MKRPCTVVSAFCVAATLAVASGARAGEAGPGRAEGPKTLALHAKDPRTWAILPRGAGGRLAYDETAGTFTLVAQRLEPNTAYALVRSADGAATGDLLGWGRSGAGGELRLTGSWSDWTAKFWLVLGGDVEEVGARGARLTAWHPERYLFEEKVLGIDCGCDDEGPAPGAR
ncbi:MAG: hypothetical protein HGA98_00265 [Deltaproteobacteria bacterium]|nr:hypothetical protein [Deltaproteobacteria bacterium]